MKKLGDVWDSLPDTDYTSKYIDENTKIRMYEVVGKKFSETTSISTVLECLRKFQDRYGERAKKALDNEGIDWKAMMHALRACYQLIELYTTGTITLPRPEAKFLIEVRTGKLPYNIVGSILDDSVELASKLSTLSTLPKEPNRKFWEDFLYNTMSEYYSLEWIFDD